MLFGTKFLTISLMCDKLKLDNVIVIVEMPQPCSKELKSWGELVTNMLK